jgi:hypothetical protein
MLELTEQSPKWHRKHAMSVYQDDLLDEVVVVTDVLSIKKHKNLFSLLHLLSKFTIFGLIKLDLFS